jgi:hypothetical protein
VKKFKKNKQKVKKFGGVLKTIKPTKSFPSQPSHSLHEETKSYTQENLKRQKMEELVVTPSPVQRADPNQPTVHKRCKMVFKLMETREIDIINAPLPPKHPRIMELYEDFNVFNKVKKAFDEGRYSNTYQLGLDLRKIFDCYKKIYFEDPNKVKQVTDLELYFEELFEDLENQPIGAPEADVPTSARN